MKQFRDLLTEKEISAFSTWEKELHKIVFDPRYLLLTSKERKQVFDRYVRDRAEEERREKRNRLKEKKDAFRKLLEEAKLSTKSVFIDFANKFCKDEKFKGVEKMRDRESIFNEHMSELRKKEKEDRIAKEKQNRKEFFALLKERSDIVDRHAHWSDVKKTLESDARYKAVDSSNQKEDWFLDHIHDLKEEHRREKEKKKRDKSKSPKRDDKEERKRDKDKKRSKSRSRSREKNKKDKKKDKKRSSRSRSPRSKSKSPSRENKEEMFKSWCLRKDMERKVRLEEEIMIRNRDDEEKEFRRQENEKMYKKYLAVKLIDDERNLEMKMMDKRKEESISFTATYFLYIFSFSCLLNSFSSSSLFLIIISSSNLTFLSISFLKHQLLNISSLFSRLGDLDFDRGLLDLDDRFLSFFLSFLFFSLDLDRDLDLFLSLSRFLSSLSSLLGDFDLSLFFFSFSLLCSSFKSWI
jgi:transcription elongation regulator 1